MAQNIAHRVATIANTIAVLPEQVRPALQQIVALVEAVTDGIVTHVGDNQQDFANVNQGIRNISDRVSLLENGLTSQNDTLNLLGTKMDNFKTQLEDPASLTSAPAFQALRSSSEAAIQEVRDAKTTLDGLVDRANRVTSDGNALISLVEDLKTRVGNLEPLVSNLAQAPPPVSQPPATAVDYQALAAAVGQAVATRASGKTLRQLGNVGRAIRQTVQIENRRSVCRRQTFKKSLQVGKNERSDGRGRRAGRSRLLDRRYRRRSSDRIHRLRARRHGR